MRGRAGGESGCSGSLGTSLRISETANDQPDAQADQQHRPRELDQAAVEDIQLPEQEQHSQGDQDDGADGLLAPPEQRTPVSEGSGGTGRRSVRIDRAGRWRRDTAPDRGSGTGGWYEPPMEELPGAGWRRRPELTGSQGSGWAAPGRRRVARQAAPDTAGACRG